VSEINKKQKFLAAFGVVSADTASKRQREIGKMLADLELEIEKLPDGDWADQPRKKYGGNVDSLTQELARQNAQQLTDKQKYAACATIEVRIKEIAKKVKVLVIAEEQIDGLRQMAPEELDKLVAGKGAKVSTPEDQGFMVAAIRARFDVDQMYGDLSSNALPRFYKALKMVPEDHARLNPMLKNIKRSKQSDSSDYVGGVININAGETGPWKSGRLKYSDFEGKELKLDHFDAHTLHEVGHAVDDSAGFMTERLRNVEYGGWDESSMEDVRDIMLAKLEKKWGKRLDKNLLKSLVETALLGNFKLGVDIIRKNQARASSMSRQEVLDHPATKDADAVIAQFLIDFQDDPDSEEAQTAFRKRFRQQDYIAKVDKADNTKFVFMSQIMNGMRKEKARAADVAAKLCDAENAGPPLPEQSVLDEIEKEPAFQWASAMQKDFWFAGASVIEASAWNGYIYHKDKKWWKYPAAARGMMVSPYQFRSPAEWFAEIYAVHMLRKLPPSRLTDAIDAIKPKEK